MPRTYAGLVAVLPPRPIRNRTSLAKTCAMVDRLAGFKLNPDQEDYLDALSTFVELYESKRFPMPPEDADGNYPAVEYARVSLARKILARRRAAGLSQAELARRASIRPETLNRIEKGRTTPDVATVVKIERALKSAER